MTQTSNRFFDEIGRLMNDAAGAAQGVKREVDTVVRNQAERILRDLDLVKREEFDAVKDMARLAREENEALKGRLRRWKPSSAFRRRRRMPAARRRTGTFRIHALRRGSKGRTQTSLRSLRKTDCWPGMTASAARSP